MWNSLRKFPSWSQRPWQGGRRAPNHLSCSRWGPRRRPRYSGWKSVGARRWRRKRTHILSILSHQQTRGTTKTLGSSARTAPAQSLTLQTTATPGSRCGPPPGPNRARPHTPSALPVPPELPFPTLPQPLWEPSGFPSPCSHATRGGTQAWPRRGVRNGARVPQAEGAGEKGPPPGRRGP